MHSTEHSPTIARQDVVPVRLCLPHEEAGVVSDALVLGLGERLGAGAELVVLVPGGVVLVV